MENDRKKFLSMSIDQKIDKVNLIHIDTDESERITNIIKNCHKSYHRAGQAKNIFICGTTGAGKTTICERYARLHPRVDSDGDDRVVVLYVKVPSPATIKGLASKLLDALGDPKPERGSTENITFRLKKLLKACKVELIILDEFQHLTDNKSDNARKQTSNWLKLLIEEANVPIILIGLKESSAIFTLNRQLNRRFSQRYELNSFSWNEKVDKKKLQTFLYKFDKMLPLPDDSGLANGDMADRFYFASNGVIAYIIKLLRFAAEEAIEVGLRKITLELLEKTYHEQIESEKPGQSNPFAYEKFYIEYEELKKEVAHQEGGMNKRIKSKEKEETVATVLN
jgi:Cdc6-like AAA superfamily ATPase